MKVGILTCRDHHNPGVEVGSSILRGDNLIKYWPEAELYRPDGQYDALIFQKARAPEIAKAFRGIKILDMCDPSGKVEAEMIPLVDAITVSSAGLRDRYVSDTLKPVLYIPDRHDLSLFEGKQKVHSGPVRTVCWFGYIVNSAALWPWLEPIREMGLKLKVIADHEYPFADENVRFDWLTLFDEIMAADVVLNPPKSKYQSTNKTTLAWLLNMPVAESLEQLAGYVRGADRNPPFRTYLGTQLDIRKSVGQFADLIRALQPVEVA